MNGSAADLAKALNVRQDGFYRHQLVRDLFEKEILAPILARKATVPDGSPASKAILDLFDRYEAYCLSGQFEQRDYMLLRALYIFTRNGLCEEIGNRLKGLFPPQPIDVSGTLFSGDADRVGAAAEALRRDGVYRFSQPLPTAFIAALRDRLLDCDAYNEHGRHIGERYGEGARYRRIFVAEKDLVVIPEMVQLATDPLVMAIIQANFGCQPILNTLATYKTHPEPADGFAQDADAAQAYHFDFHTFRWLKMFVYLNDIGEEAGPHHFVKTSHWNRPDALWREGRIPDREIDAVYGPNGVSTICGPAGTAFIADTSAFHKGSLPTHSPRILAQFEYCNSLFGPEHLVGFEQRHGGKLLLESALRYGSRTAQRFLMRYL
jgi:hypothetical protein